jgi:hypothetical protein
MNLPMLLYKHASHARLSARLCARLWPRARGCVWCHRPGLRALAAGITWTSRTANAQWAGRGYHSSVVDAAGAIYVIGGQSSTGYLQDVWATTDGGARPYSVMCARGVLGGYSRGATGVLRGTLG